MTSPYQKLYQERLCTSAEAVSLIPSGTKIAMSLAAGQPASLLMALAQRAQAGDVTDLRIYYMLCTSLAGDTVFDLSLRDRIKPVSLFHGGVERILDKQLGDLELPGVDFIPTHFSQVPDALVNHIGVDTLLASVAPMDADGNFSLSVSTDYAITVARKSGIRIILEVNPNMPYIRGNCMVPIKDVAAVIEYDGAIPSVPAAQPSDVDTKIAAIIADFVNDGDCLQMGIGALPDAVCSGLVNHRNLGIHTEIMTPGLANLMRTGVVDNSRKQVHKGKTIFTFAYGDRALYDFLDHNPDVEAHPVQYVNDPALISQNENVISVNATLQIDLQGACNSEYVGGRQYSAVGGQLDFVRGATASKGGRSIIACHSTAAKGKISRITAALDGPVTTPRTDTQIIVTEYGWVNLKGKSLRERAKALIDIAHPDFREELSRQAHALVK